MHRPLEAVALLVGLTLAEGGCLVHSRCQTDDDCNGDESCDRQDGECRVECVTDRDCWVGEVYVGKECFHHRCQFRLDERVKAPDFCLAVVNPKSSYYNKQLCLSQLKGKVVLTFYGLLA